MDPTEANQPQTQQADQPTGPFSARAKQASDGARRVFVYASRRPSFTGRLLAWFFIALGLIIFLLLVIPALILGIIAAALAGLWMSIARLFNRPKSDNAGRQNVRVIRRPR